jgi:hypothetical protein
MRDIGAEILRHFNVPGPTPEQTGPDAANGTLSLFT